jgi:hypothetical protein
LTALVDLDTATSQATRAELTQAEASADQALILDISEVIINVHAVRLIADALVQATRHGIASRSSARPTGCTRSPHLDTPRLPLHSTVAPAVADLRQAAGAGDAAAETAGMGTVETPRPH